ncbi:Vegetative incompatibility protein HET-E-1 [Colletotrichum tropicale]|nr:Vegetative incompatibility protein HET-E-1 [Colletotrichum tropicale]
MWLIDISKSRALRLVEFLGDPPDEYAILSHTWGDHEITFEEFKAMTTSSNRSLNYGVSRADTDIHSSPGYVKILKAAMLARSQSYTYLWVDTCCINKASSAELSESINSMYLWYRKASVCYAYLSDVGPDEARSIEEEGSQFRNSRWFTRGWTLQELIAPHVVEFYVSDWSPIHTKEAGNESFCRVLSDITGIYTDVLAGTMLLSDVSVADKMRWASKRQTKRAEDIAYCLLGVFDVNMPLLYGEGPRAFVRLQEEILRQTGDQSLFLWALSSISSQGFSGAQALHGLLADSPDAFCGLGIHHIRPLQPLGSEDGEPASMTSKGLRTNMLLFPIDSSDYFAVLDCTAFRSQSPLLREDACIFLRRLWGNQFARIDRSVASGVQFFPDGVAELKGKGAITTVYVKQKPSYALPEVTINSCMFRGGHDANSSSSSFSVMEAYPPERFSMTTSVVQIREPQSGQAIVTLRFGHKYKKHWYPLVDVSVGLQSQNSEWILFYKMRPFNGSKLQIVYQDIQGFNLFSKTGFHNKDQFFGHALAHTTTHQHRGRRFLQLDVFMPKFNYPALISVEQELQLNNTHPFLEDNVLRQIQDVTRQCCYQDKLEYIFSFDQSPSLDGVRANIEGFSQLSKWFDAFSIDESGPYASMIHSVRNGNFSLIKTLVAQDQSLIECQTSELDDFRPVHWAAAKPYPGLMKTLANCKADLTSRTRSGWLAIHVAILSQSFPTVEYLWDKTKRSHDQGSLVTSTGETLSHLLAAYAAK